MLLSALWRDAWCLRPTLQLLKKFNNIDEGSVGSQLSFSTLCTLPWNSYRSAISRLNFAICPSRRNNSIFCIIVNVKMTILTSPRLLSQWPGCVWMAIWAIHGCSSYQSYWGIAGPSLWPMENTWSWIRETSNCSLKLETWIQHLQHACSTV